ncbi:MAG: hypothetical protein IT304_09205 [Dehalococcoidia bacterium]|nr:hypothetical protein [Dehalococcoidia bacterium]
MADRRDAFDDDVQALVASWLEEYRLAGLSEEGDPEAHVERLQYLVDEAGADSPAGRAFALFLARIEPEPAEPLSRE